MKPHDWQADDRGTFTARDGVTYGGVWYECRGCHHRILRTDNDNDFQWNLAIIFHFMEEVESLSEAELKKRSYGSKGYHGVLADDCAEAAVLPVVMVMAT